MARCKSFAKAFPVYFANTIIARMFFARGLLAKKITDLTLVMQKLRQLERCQPLLFKNAVHDLQNPVSSSK